MLTYKINAPCGNLSEVYILQYYKVYNNIRSDIVSIVRFYIIRKYQMIYEHKHLQLVH